MTPGQKRGEDKLYKQWMEHGDLSSEEAIPRKDIPQRDMPLKESPREISSVSEETKRRSPALYILLAVGITMLCIGLFLILTRWS